MKLTNEQLRELSVIARMPEGNIVAKWLAMHQAEHHEAILTARGEDVFRAQGRAQAVQLLLDDLRQAPQRLQRASESRPAPQQLRTL